MAAVAAEYEGRVNVVGMAGRGDVSEMQEFVADTGTGNMVHVVDDARALWQRFDVVSQPAFAFIGADGTARTFTGGMDADRLRAAADEMLRG